MTKNKYKPILFNTEMVQAILNGAKSQTRREIKKKYSNTDLEYKTDKYGTRLIERQNDVSPPIDNGNGTVIHRMTAYAELKPKYHVGDILWVRETWQYLEIKEDWNDELAENNYMICYTYKASNDLRPNGVSAEEFCGNWVITTEDRWNNADYSIESEEVEGRDVWKPSIHMPKEAARIFLRVTKVRCERLHDITEGDAITEGVELFDTNLYKDYENINNSFRHARISFASLWVSINSKDSWHQNPYVWVYEFEKIEKPNDF